MRGGYSSTWLSGARCRLFYYRTRHIYRGNEAAIDVRHAAQRGEPIPPWTHSSLRRLFRFRSHTCTWPLYTWSVEIITVRLNQRGYWLWTADDLVLTVNNRSRRRCNSPQMLNIPCTNQSVVGVCLCVCLSVRTMTFEWDDLWSRYLLVTRS